jgi:hypothetical protein
MAYEKEDNHVKEEPVEGDKMEVDATNEDARAKSQREKEEAANRYPYVSLTAQSIRTQHHIRN